MLNTVEELLNLSRKLGLQCDISENNVTFGETEEDIKREKVESQQIYFNDRDLFITNTYMLKYHMPCIIYDTADKSFTEEELETLSCIDTSTFQITSTIYTDEEGYCEFNNNITTKIVDITSGFDKNFKLTLKQLMEILGITEDDLKEKFNAIYDENGDIELIDFVKIAEFVKSLSTPDWTYVIIQLFLNK